MQLFTRQLMTAGPEAEAAAWATEMAAAASAKMGTEVALWAAGFGAPRGAMAFTARVDGLADLMAKAAPLAGDADYQAKVAKGAAIVVGPPQDSLATPLHGDLGDPPPVGAMAVVTNAVIANGQYAEAVGWGIDVAQHVTSLTGMPVGLMMQEYGTFGQLTWIGIGADAAAVDASATATNGDADYIKKMSASGNLFVPGSGSRSLVTRVA
ncbi:MAG: hypothetical protein WBL31_06995 [Ilumatobacteraceae bacterium]